MGSSTTQMMVKARMLIDPENREDPKSWISVDAEQLKIRIIHSGDLTQEQVLADEYRCWHKVCSAKVQPYAIGYGPLDSTEEFKRDPKFILWENHFHSSKCPFKKRTNGNSGAHHEHSEAPPRDNYPNGLLLNWDVPILSQPSGKSQKSIVKASSVLKTSSNWKAKTIVPLVDIFHRYKGFDLQLAIKDVDGKVYREVFQQIISFDDRRLDQWKIYFSEIVYTALPCKDSDPLEFKLTDGEYPSGNSQSRPKIKSSIKLNPEAWPAGEETKFRQEINDFRIKVGESRRRREQHIPFVFFLGQSIASDNTQFSLMIDSWRLIDLRLVSKQDVANFRNLYVQEIPEKQSIEPEVNATPPVVIPTTPKKTPEELPEPIIVAPDVSNIPRNEDSQEDRTSGDTQNDLPEISDIQPPQIHQENSVLEKSRRLPVWLATILIGLSVATGVALVSVVVENNQNNQPVEEVN